MSARRAHEPRATGRRPPGGARAAVLARRIGPPLALIAACSPDELRPVVRFEPADLAGVVVRIEFFVADACPADAAVRVGRLVGTIERGSAPPPLGAAPDGAFALIAQGIDAECLVAVAGCTPVDDDASGEVPIVLQLSPSTARCTMERCDRGRCRDEDADVPTPLDAGADVASPMDAGVPPCSAAGEPCVLDGRAGVCDDALRCCDRCISGGRCVDEPQACPSGTPGSSCVTCAHRCAWETECEIDRGCEPAGPRAGHCQRCDPRADRLAWTFDDATCVGTCTRSGECCAGCVDDGGTCAPGDSAAACGAGGARCETCAAGWSCADGRCGCATSCVHGAACYSLGDPHPSVACQVCAPEGWVREAANTPCGRPVDGGVRIGRCSATTSGLFGCCTGCIDGARVCRLGTANTFCGSAGIDCVSCTAPDTCADGACR